MQGTISGTTMSFSLGTALEASMGTAIFSILGNIIGIVPGTLLEHQWDLLLADIPHYDENIT
jgi:hypothetical protein